MAADVGDQVISTTSSTVWNVIFLAVEVVVQGATGDFGHG